MDNRQEKGVVDSRGSLCKHHPPVCKQCEYSGFLASALELCFNEVPLCSWASR